ncbi:MAG: acyltransferase [Prosthecobacter sp.]
MRRLLPLLWFLITVKLVLIFSLNLAGLHECLDWFQVLRSYTLLPAPGYPIILPAWTLSFELFFCTLWSVLLCFPQRIRLATMGVWAVAILAYGRIYYTPSLWLPGFVMHPYFLDFIAGAALAEVAPYMAISLRGSFMMLVGGALLLVAMAVEPELKAYPQVVRRIVWGGAAFVVVAGLFWWEYKNIHFVVPSGFRLLARSSYSIYLTHSLVLYVVMQGLAGHLTNTLLTQLLLAAVASATLGIGILLHRWVEVPLQRVLHVFKSFRKGEPGLPQS